MTSSGLTSSLTLTKYSMFIQLIFRVSTFILNAFLLRFMTKEKLGLVNVRLTLLYMNVIFLSREAFRRACLGEGQRRITKEFVNVLWLILPIGCVIGSVLAAVWLYFVEVDRSVFPDYGMAVVCFVLASLIELASEPFAIISQACQFVRLRAVAEGLGNLIKCLITVGLVYSSPDSGLLPFCIAQIVCCAAMSCTFLFYYLYFFSKGINKKVDDFPITSFSGFFPSFRPFHLDAHTGRLVTSFWLQCVVKQLLTEGEKFVMTFFELVSLANQGVFDVINNLGSLVARCFFLPIEDGTYHLFCQNLKRGIPAEKQNPTQLTETANALATVLQSISYVGCCFVFFGHAYAFLFLDLFGGEILSSGEGPYFLRWYCGYILLLAWNGVSEGFMQAMMQQSEVNRHSSMMMLFSISFLISAVLFVKSAGIVGFLWANYVNMALRICNNLRFMRHYFRNTNYAAVWRSVFPDPFVLTAFSFSAVVVYYSEMYLCCADGWLWKICHIGNGVACVLLVLGLILVRHENLRRLLINFLRTSKPASR